MKYINEVQMALQSTPSYNVLLFNKTM